MIRVGIGGWVFKPWRGEFYPEGLPQARELDYASRKLTAIEINGTFYSTQKPESFRKWAAETPDDFVFSLKAPRFATHRRVLAEAGESIERFFASGVTELKGKLGPILWQLHPGKKFEPDDFAAFLALLPRRLDGKPVRHAVEVRHESFKSAQYLELARRHRVATVFTDSADYPSFADLTGDFVYVRTMRADKSLKDGVTPQALAQLAACTRAWRDGGEPDALPRVEASASPGAPRDVFLYFISADKEKAPAAALALLKRLREA